ncbi:S-(+)-linalool synthase, chloroplastic, partial [Dichanthelium oligosanthes]
LEPGLPGLARYVRQSLDHPYHLSLMQYKARHHLSYLQSLPNRKSTTAIEELATAEFHLNKLQHQKEMEEVKRYRVQLTKIISLIYVVDDLFDLVGTLEELSLFTEAIKMWNTGAADSLPSGMRSCYKAIYATTYDIADTVEEEHGFNPVNHLRNSWAVLFDGFMVESKWLAAGLVPAAEDYLRNGVVTSGMPLTLTHVLFLLGHDHAACHDAAKLTDHIPPPISCPAKILRLWDDMGSAEDEAQEGLDGSYRDFYLMENPRCAPSDAEEHMRRLIAREWEELNRECFSRRTFSSSFMRACLNATRMVSVMYSYDKEQRLLVLEDYARMLLL